MHGNAEARPSQLSRLPYPHYVEILKDRLTACYVGKGVHIDVGVVRSDVPAPSDCSIYYFEVKIVEANTSPKISVGLTRKNSLLTRHPGSEKKSIGYRSEDGRKLRNARSHPENYGPSYGQDDVIGCGLHYSQNRIFFTKNGMFLGVACALRSAVYYPTIGMHALGERICCNFEGPFIFDLQGLIESELLDEREIISREKCERVVLNHLIRSYLLHSGHMKTLEALDVALAEEAAAAAKQENDPTPERRSEGPLCAASNLLRGEDGNGMDCSVSSSAEVSLLVNQAILELHNEIGMPTSTRAETEGDGHHAEENSAVSHQEPVEVPIPSADDTNCLNVSPSACKAAPWTEFLLTPSVHSILEAHLTHRADLRRLVSDGNILGALSLLEQTYPTILQSEQPTMAEALLLSQQVIEFLRDSNAQVMDAVKWIRERLPRFRDSSLQIQAAVNECCSLVCYPIRSDIGRNKLFDLSRRYLAADKLNEHILKHELKAPEWSSLHLLVRQIVACKKILRERTGNQGPIPSSRILCQPLVRKLRKFHKNDMPEDAKTK